MRETMGVYISRSSGGSGISQERKAQITSGIMSHSTADNDRAAQSYESRINKEQNIVDNADAYIKMGIIQSTKDTWYREHVDALRSLSAQYEYFKKERARIGV